jgi:hypothetical protein
MRFPSRSDEIFERESVMGETPPSGAEPSDAEFSLVSISFVCFEALALMEDHRAG